VALTCARAAFGIPAANLGLLQAEQAGLAVYGWVFPVDLLMPRRVREAKVRALFLDRFDGAEFSLW
jgi:hypothetical protein